MPIPGASPVASTPVAAAPLVSGGFAGFAYYYAMSEGQGVFKNVASQKVTLFAFNTSTGAAVTGDSANQTGYVSKDDGAVTVLGTSTPTEDSSAHAAGMYTFTLTQAETNADKLKFTAVSTTANVVLVPAVLYTNPPNFTTGWVSSAGKINEVVLCDTLTTYTGNTPQTGDAFARLGVPANVTIAADIAEVEAETDLLLAGVTVAGYASGQDPATLVGQNLLIDGKTFQAAIQYVAASASGKVSGAGTGTEVFKGLDGATTRLTVTADSAGNRSAVVYG